MRQAIVTKFHGPTEKNLDPRVSATASAGRVYVWWNDALSEEQNHTAAAQALAKKFGWHGVWHGGGLPGGKGNVYVQVDNLDEEIRT